MLLIVYEHLMSVTWYRLKLYTEICEYHRWCISTVEV